MGRGIMTWGVALALAWALVLGACARGPAAETPPPEATAPKPEATAPSPEATPTEALPDEEKVLNIYNWTEYMPEDILRDFEREYGVKINYDTYSSNEELLAKLQAGGLGLYDLIVPSDYMVEIMIKQDLLEPLDHRKLPNLKYLAEEFRNPSYDPGNRYSVPYMWGTTGLAYNKKYVQPEPDSLAVFWDPRYAGKIVLVDDSREVVGIALQLLGYSKNDTDPAHLEQAKQKLLELAPRVKAYDSDNPKALLISEEVWLGWVWNAEAVLAAKENPDIAYVLPKEGGSVWIDNMAIPKKAPHPGWAHVFINYLYRPEVAARLAEAFPYGTPNAEALPLLPEEIRNNPAVYPPPEALRRAEYTKDVGEAAALFDRIFTEMKVAGGR